MSAIESIIRPRERDLGGFSVRRVLPAGPRQMVGPFIFFDALGPATFAPGTGVDVRPHPHIGLATVTWLFEGELLHRDSLGFTQLIRPGEVNWMTAGSGIAHSERTPPENRQRPFRLHGIQSWVALPKHAEETAPEFHHYGAGELPALDAEGVHLRVIAGTLLGLTSPVRTFSSMGYGVLELATGARCVLPPEHEERAVYLVDGDLTIDGEAAAGRRPARRCCRDGTWSCRRRVPPGAWCWVASPRMARGTSGGTSCPAPGARWNAPSRTGSWAASPPCRARRSSSPCRNTECTCRRRARGPFLLKKPGFGV